MTHLRTPLARARGLGSAKDGTHHFWTQRLTGLALVPLFAWFVTGMVAQVGASHAEFTDWLARPFNTVMMLITVVVIAWHSMLGLQVVVEDYVHAAWAKLTLLISFTFAHVALAAAAAYAVLRIGLGS
jgi:succinate dehydrogenase / fumarate reductase membrane anchor subunit